MIRLSFLLITVPLLLGIAYLVKKALQRSGVNDMLSEQNELRKQLVLVKDLNVEEVKQARAELARIKKELQ